jgi:hypothetical protein
MSSQCASIKSRKHSALRCPNPATRGDFCAKHCKSKVAWVSTAPQPPPFTRRQKAAADKIHKFWKFHGRRKARKIHGPTLFSPSLSHNDKDIYTFDSITTIPFTYHFSYIDTSNKVWTFDIRFLTQLLQYGKELRNPFSQELIQESVLQRLQARAESLRKRAVPILYAEATGLTPEQLWNQKVLDVFLRMSSLGYGVNMLWYESMTVRHHKDFYIRLYDMWHTLYSAEKERIVPGYKSARTQLFRWTPSQLDMEIHDIRWWRKQNLALMNAFFVRGQDRATQGCGALYILTSLARTHPRVAEAFPWLLADAV